MANEEFNRIRDDYINARKQERENLIYHLKSDGYIVTTRGRAGSGYDDYSGGGKLDPPHDLRHHKWIDAKKGRVKFFISLNPYEVDNSSANPHHLYDRIGVQAYLNDNTETDIRTAMIITKWSLPITDKTWEELKMFLDKIARMFTEFV